MIDLSTTALAELISKRHACLAQLRAIGLKQAELIATSETGALLRLLTGKQQLIAALQSLEHQLQPFGDQEPDARQWPSLEARQACAAQAAECRQLLEEVMRLEQENEKQMTLRRNDVAAQLQNATAASRARGAYRNQQTPAPSGTAPAQPTHAPTNTPTSFSRHIDLSSEA